MLLIMLQGMQLFLSAAELELELVPLVQDGAQLAHAEGGAGGLRVLVTALRGRHAACRALLLNDMTGMNGGGTGSGIQAKVNKSYVLL